LSVIQTAGKKRKECLLEVEYSLNVKAILTKTASKKSKPGSVSRVAPSRLWMNRAVIVPVEEVIRTQVIA